MFICVKHMQTNTHIHTPQKCIHQHKEDNYAHIQIGWTYTMCDMHAYMYN